MTSGLRNNLYQHVTLDAPSNFETVRVLDVLLEEQGLQRESVADKDKTTVHNLKTPIIVGLSSDDFNSHHQQLYICDHSVFFEASKILTVHFISLVGVALPYLYAGDGCRYVWHFQKHVSVFHLLQNFPTCGRNKVWFVLEAFAISSLNSLVREKLKCQLISTQFKREVGTSNLDTILSPLCQYEETPVQMIFHDAQQLQLMCPSILSSHLTLPSILTNAMMFVNEIRINPGDPDLLARGASGLISSVLKCLLSLCMVNAPSPETEMENKSSVPSQFPETTFINVPDNSIQVDEWPVKKEDDALSDAMEGEEVGMGTGDVSLDPDGCNPSLAEVNETAACVSSNIDTSGNECVPRYRCEGFLIVECPLCGMTFRKSRNRVQSLTSHILHRHPANADVLLESVKKKYLSPVFVKKARATSHGPMNH